jgi:hypothetical protein
MSKVEHVLIAYGDQLGYHHGAKYQILRCWDRWYSGEGKSVCIVTDKPQIFEGYPLRVLQITEQQIKEWSLGGLQHFGIKIKGLELAVETGMAEKYLLLDTDTYWVKDPSDLVGRIRQNSFVMYCDEGFIKNNKNKSISRFEEGLDNQTIAYGDKLYQLENDSRMLNSSIIGLHVSDVGLLDEAFKLFSVLEPLVEAHTVEQFSLAEALRRHRFHVEFGRSHTRDWSSIGRKNYVTPLLQSFFIQYGEHDFSRHLTLWNQIKVKRPLRTLLRQKYQRLVSKLNEKNLK